MWWRNPCARKSALSALGLHGWKRSFRVWCIALIVLVLQPALIAADNLRITPVASQVAGAPFTIRVTARNGGSTDTSYTGTVQFSSTDGTATLPGNYTFVAGDNGVHDFTLGVTLRTSGSQDVEVTDTVLTASRTVTVNPAAAASLTLTGVPGSLTAGTASTVTVTARDAFSNTATGYTGTVDFTSTDGAASLPANYTFVGGDNGVRVFTSGVTLRTAGSQDVTITDVGTPALTDDQTATVNAAAAASLTLTGLPGSLTAGTSSTVTVTALDTFGNPASGYTGTVHFTSTDGAATVPTDYTFVGGDNGVHVFTAGVTLRTANSRTVTVTDVGTPAFTDTETVTINSGAAASLTLTGLPGSLTAGTASTVTVTVRDGFSNLASGYTGTVNFTSTDGAATLPANYTFVGGDNGAHVFTSGVTLRTAGSRDVTVTDVGTPALTDDQTVTVNAGAATSLTITGVPGSLVAGTLSTVTVTARDGSGNPATGYTGTVHFTSTDPQAVLPADYTFLAGDNAVRTFTNGVQLRTVGTRTITATDTVTGTITGVHSDVSVTANTAVQLVFTTQPGSATAGAAFLTQPVVRTRDAHGNNSTVGIVGVVPVTIALSSGAGSLSGVTTPDVGPAGTPGVASFSGLRIDNASDAKTLTASATLNGSAVNVASSSFTVAPAVADHLAIQVQPPATVAAGATMTPAPVIRILDQFNNLRSSDTLAVTATRSGGAGTLQGTTVVNAVGGVATFNALSHQVANDITILFTCGALTQITSGTVSVTAGSAVALKITGAGTQVVGSSNAITITAIDSLGNPATAYSGAVALTFGGADPSSNPATPPTVENSSAVPISFGTSTSLLFTNGVATSIMRLYDAELDTITVSDGTINASGANALVVNVTPAAATRLVITGPSNLTAGVVGNLTITAADPYGNADTTYINTHSLTFSGASASTNPVTAPTVENNVGAQVAFGVATPLTFTAGVALVNATPANGRVRLYRAGDLFIGASDGSISAASTDRLAITVVNAVANKVVVSGSASQTAGQTQVVAVTIQDQYGNADVSQDGAVNVTFIGGGTGGGFNQTNNRPRVSRRTSGAEVDFGTATALQFLDGVASAASDALQCRMRLVRVGTASITATAGSLIASTPLSVVVSAGPPTQLGIAAVGTSTPMVGQATTVDVVVQDAGGNTVTTPTAIDLALTVTPTPTSLRAGYGGTQIAAGASGTTITGVILDRAEANVVVQAAGSPALYTAATGPTPPIAVQNDQPVLSIASGQLTYSGGSGAIPFGTPGIAVSDINSEGFAPFFTGAIITASITAGGVPTEDLLQVRSAGTISVSGSVVSWNATPIAILSGGFAGSPLVVTVNGTDVEVTAVSALLENLCFHNIGGANPTVGVRTVTLAFSDGSSGAPGGARSAVAVTRTVNVVIGNALPVIEANSELSVTRSSTTLITNSNLRVSDEESGAGLLVFTVVDFPSEGELLLGSGAGAIPLTAGGTESFTQADIDGSLLAYHHQGSSLPGDVFTFIVSDGLNQLPLTTFSITVPGADANPVLFLPLATLLYNENAAPSVLVPSAPLASGTLVSDANTFEFSNGALVVEIVDEDNNPDAHPGDRLSVRSQTLPGLPQYDPWNYIYVPEIDYTGHIAMVGTDVVRRQYSFYHYWANVYFGYPDPGSLPFPSPSPSTSYPASWYFGYPVPLDVRIATRDATLIGEGGPLRFSLLSGVGAGYGDPIVSAQAVAHLIDNLSFSNLSDDPPARDRWLRITLSEAAPSTAAGVSTMLLKITVANDPPVFEVPAPLPAPVETFEALAGVPLRVRVLANDPDLPSTSSLTYSLTSITPPSAGVATVNATSGALGFTPLASFVGPVTLVARATDNLGAWVEADVEVEVLAGPTDLGPLVVSDPPFESFAGEALSYALVIRPDPGLPVPAPGTVSVTMVGDVPVGAVLNAGVDQLHPLLEVTSLVRPPDGVYTFGIRVEINYSGNIRVGYQPVTFKVRASGAPN